jgi:hypothetical protein
MRIIGEIFNGCASISIDERHSITNGFDIEKSGRDEALRLVKSYFLLDPSAPVMFVTSGS